MKGARQAVTYQVALTLPAVNVSIAADASVPSFKSQDHLIGCHRWLGTKDLFRV